MNALTNLLAFLAALSLATERITEVIKGFPGLSQWLTVEKADRSKEEFRKAAIHIIAIAVGTVLVSMTQDQLSTVVGVKYSGFWAWLLFGAMASGGSGLWNSALDIVREVNKQKQIVSDQLKQKAVKAA